MKGGCDMVRQSPASINIDPNVRCMKVYPVPQTSRTLENLKTVGIKLSRDQAIHLSKVLLAVAQEWEEIGITAYRLDRRNVDGTYHITVTSMVG